MLTLDITEVSFVRASAEQQRGGLEGWARVVIGGSIRIDRLALRRTLAGELRVFFPEHVDRAGIRHALVWVVSAKERAEFESRILQEIRARGGLS
ncbi:MAG: hypothetical protein IPJ77_07300 [Planctomycetes bacterium]|nr:hypothetical protein [Planctomycetota bacterium]